MESTNGEKTTSTLNSEAWHRGLEDEPATVHDPTTSVSGHSDEGISAGRAARTVSTGQAA